MKAEQTNANASRPLVVGIGASAEGVDAICELLSALGEASEMAVLIAGHFGSDGSAGVVGKIADATSMEVVEVTQSAKLLGNTVYLSGNDDGLRASTDEVRSGPVEDMEASGPIDQLFHSIALSYGDHGVGVVLAGSGSDGSLGLKEISDYGGVTFAQSLATAESEAMPRSAADIGIADHVLSPDEIAAELLKYRRHFIDLERGGRAMHFHEEVRDLLPDLCETLEQATGHDFQHYKSSTLVRRIQRRIHVLKLNSADEYLGYLQHHSEEAQVLFRELLIGVTSFFRDPDAFESLRRDVLPSLFVGRDPEDPVRIWVAGCANGAEAYSMSILCEEVLRETNSSCRVQIFATDIDSRALNIARNGVYPVGIAEHVSSERLKRFFVRRGNQFHVCKEVRDHVLFSSHNLISDPPFSRMDLISCRNLLIYLGSHLQDKLFSVFHYSLRPGGYLFLGPSESMTSHGDLFRCVNVKHRISQRKGASTRPTPTARAASVESPRSSSSRGGSEHLVDLTEVAQRMVLDEFAPKYAVIDEFGQILNHSSDLEKYVKFQFGDFHNNLVKIVDSSLRIGLRSLLKEAVETSRKVQRDDLSIRSGDQIQRMMLTVQPMPRLGESESIYLVVFHEIGLPATINEEDNSHPHSETDADSLIFHLERELESTRYDLDKSLQDMEAANEELKSSNEELLSMNEELQSANEELEASKEEIREGSLALQRANTDLENLLRSTQIAAVFLDGELNVRSFTPAIQEIYSLLNSDIGRPLERFVPLVDDMPKLPSFEQIVDEGVVEHTVIAQSGKAYLRRVLPYRAYSGECEGIVVTFIDVTQLRESQELFQLLVDASAQIVWVTDADGTVTEDSPSWRAFTGQTFEEWIGEGWQDALHPADLPGLVEHWQAAVASGEQMHHEYRLQHHEGGYRWTQVRAVAQRTVDGSIHRWVGMNIDIDDRKRAERELEKAKIRLDLSFEASEMAPWSWDIPTGEVVSNENLNRLFGFPPNQDITTKEFIERIDEADRERVLASVERSVEGGDIFEEEYAVHRVDGQRRWLRARGRTQKNAEGKVEGFFGVVSDITERRQREQDLVDREAHLRRVINNQLGLVGVIDCNGNLVEVDDRSLEIAHTTRADVIGKHFADAPWWSYDPNVARQMREAMQRAFDGEIVRFDVSLFAPGDDGVMIDFMIAPIMNSDGEVEYLIPSGVDIRDRYRAEQRLVENERRVSMALQAGEMAAWEWTPEKSFWEPKLFELLGLPFEQSPSPELFFSVVHPEDLPVLQQHWLEAIDGSSDYEIQFRIVRPNGLVRWISAVGIVTRDDDGKVTSIHGLNWDITDQKEYEIRLEASEERLRLALSAAELSLWQWDVNTDLWFWLDDRSEEDEFASSVPLGSLADFLERIHIDDRAEVELSIRSALENTEPFRSEYRVYSDGEFRWVLSLAHLSLEDELSSLQMVGVEVDITERKNSELNLKLNEERLRLAGEASGFGSFHIDVLKRELHWSFEVRRILGYGDTDILTESFDDVPQFIHPEDRDSYAAAIRQALTDPWHPRGDLEHRVIRPDGEVRYVRTNWLSMWNDSVDGPKVEQVIGTMLDITRQRDNERKLELARQQAEVANESKSAFVANMSHEIRTPMTSILGYAELIQGRITDPEALEYLHTIRRNGDYLLEIINDILDLSKIEAGKLEVDSEKFDPSRIVEDVRSIMEVRATEKDLILDVIYANPIPAKIHSDPKRLKQILVNLVGNAIKFTHQGKVTLTVRTVERTSLEFKIADTGIGIGPEQQQRLFKPFSQGDASVSRHFGGTGLGLAISRRLTEMLSGTVSVESELGKGSVFTLRIPVGDIGDVEFVEPGSPSEFEEKTPVATPVEQIQLDGRVLVVDDRRDVRFLTKHILTKAQATVHELEDGQQAVEYITERVNVGEVPDLILLDMQMPNLDGYETARQLRKIGYQGPIIALTADAMQGDMNRCIESGCNAYLSKPIHSRALVEMVDRFMSNGSSLGS
ncbi:PAS domain-containing protein [Thalassoglobus sp. JC818]|uniref:PAS domain-containing protein n=1 Tax=Thalassoglobus sp. JC818 TaxID=3232136 RepID=UPI003459FB8C